jgi:ATP adenylyltransferase
MKKLGSRKCIFCQKQKQGSDARNFILERAKTCFVLLNIFPYTNGHLLIAPYRHIKTMDSLSHTEREEMFVLLVKYTKRLRSRFKAQGFNVGINIGRVAGAGFPGHIHLHVVPRWPGDTNFMSAINDTKIIPESLNMTLKKLKDD